MSTVYSAEGEKSLMTEIWDPAIADDPEAFVMLVYPWGKVGTPLEKFKGPRNWQREDLQEIADHIRTNKALEAEGKLPKIFQKATASGRGVGKSALVSWLSNWFLSTRIGSSVIVTANTETQLKSRTFAEIGKWTTMLINSHWFEQQTLMVKPAEWFKLALSKQMKVDTKYYYCQGQTWSEEKPDAFAGAHNMNGVCVLFDEASGIPKSIWVVTEGFFTEPIVDRLWLPYSNPRRNSGTFFDCFNHDAKFWKLRHIDARTVEGTDPQIYENIINKYGADSDTARIEVYGQFPIQGERQFISNNIVRDAQVREILPDPFAPLIMGIDIARFGTASTVVRFRQGRDARSIHSIEWNKRDTVYSAERIAKIIDEVQPQAVNIDAGNGTGVIDILKDKGYKINEIWFGSTKNIEPEYFNVRTQMYANIRDWLPGGSIDNSPQLFSDLTAPEYDFIGKGKDKVMLESKESMTGRGLTSPDHSDALALTFAKRVPRINNPSARGGSRRSRQAQDVDYALFG